MSRYHSKHIFEEENSENQGVRTWLKHLDKVKYNYNLAKRVSTKKTPFCLRLQISGFNTVCIDANENPQIDHNGNLNNIQSEDDILIKNKTINSCSETEEKKRDPFVSLNYLSRMDQNSLVNLSKYTNMY
ncbi:hypothetical protein DMUE_0516 [Dictyocoela muelleri]|nr:hypothetical protein DMUE_0516 [Dictyocoela muelleri]